MKNKNIFVFISILIFAIIITFIGAYLIKNNQNNIKLSKEEQEEITKLNELTDNYYMENFDEYQFVSQFSYLMRKDKSEVTIEEVAKFYDYELKKGFEHIAIHFVKPKVFLNYPSIKIKKKEGPNDLEVLTVYTAIPLTNGDIFISSKYDKGGILKSSEYQKFVLESSPVHGQIMNPKPEEELYKNIRQAIEQENQEMIEGNIKYLTCDNKYSFVVMSTKKDPAIIKSFLLENKNGKWSTVLKDLEQNPKYRIFTNIKYPDFNLDMLPIYNLAEFEIISNLDNLINQLKSQGKIKNSSKATYSCATGNFAYIELDTGEKMLVYVNSNNITDAYKVKDYYEALKKMISLDSINPPTFIVNFKN